MSGTLIVRQIFVLFNIIVLTIVCPVPLRLCFTSLAAFQVRVRHGTGPSWVGSGSVWLSHNYSLLVSQVGFTEKNVKLQVKVAVMQLNE